MKRAFMTVMIVLLVGEGVVRIDQRLLRTRQQEVVAIEVEDSALLDRVSSGDYRPDASTLRILVLGDSYVYGAGIDPDSKVSRVLARALRRALDESRGPFERADVLDLSRPSNNSLDNLLALEENVATFEPHFVVLGYNITDALGRLERSEEAGSAPASGARESREGAGMLKRTAAALYGSSKLVRFVSTQVQHQLKRSGIVPPFGDFAFLTRTVHEVGHPRWRANQRVVSELGAVTHAHGARLIVYNFPSYNLLEHPELFARSNRALDALFRDGIADVYIDGWQHFAPVSEQEWFLSKYDGHPNHLAHARVADRIAQEIARMAPQAAASDEAPPPQGADAVNSETRSSGSGTTTLRGR